MQLGLRRLWPGSDDDDNDGDDDEKSWNEDERDSDDLSKGRENQISEF